MYSNTDQLELGANDKIVAQTKVTIPQDDGPIHAESSIQAVPFNDNNNCFSPSAPVLIEEKTPKTITKSTYKTTGRCHNYTSKTFIRPDTCNHCQKKYIFFHLNISVAINKSFDFQDKVWNDRFEMSQLSCTVAH